MKIIYIINSLRKGGAEGNLHRLCKFQKKKYKKKFDIIIITLINNGYYEAELQKKGIKIYSLNLDKKIKFFDFIKKIFKLRKFVKKQNPDIIQSWMYHSNFITLFIPKKFYNKLFWNIRHAELNTKISKKMTIFFSIICGLFSKAIPKKIIYCSEKSINFHENHHFYSKNKASLIYNGCSDKSYLPAKHLRLNFRKRNKIKKSDIIIGYAGRYAKQKNISSMLFAFSKITKNYNNVYLYMVGRDISYKNKELITNVNKLKLSNKVYFLDEQKNLLEFYNGIDFLLPLYFTIDVKTAKKAYNLLLEEGKVLSDIYVLADYNGGDTFLVGWEWGKILKQAPTKDFGYGVINHYIASEELRPMRELYNKSLNYSH